MIQSSTLQPKNHIECFKQLKKFGRSALNEVIVANTAYQRTTNEREVVFEPFKRLCTRIVSSFEICGTTKQAVQDARAINKKIRGNKVKVIAPAASAQEYDGTDEQMKKISQAQQGYDNLLANFTRLAEIVRKEPLYKPNETELTVESIDGLIGQIKEKMVMFRMP
ncbi:MAG: hypothetical protein HC906_04135 [Bacteroidales bacterium]|nr:hypothetical protein [Bacteroidales bacterium]